MRLAHPKIILTSFKTCKTLVHLQNTNNHNLNSHSHVNTDKCTNWTVYIYMMNGKSNILNKSSFKAFGWNGLSMVGCTINISGSIKNNLVCDSKMNKSLLSFLKDKKYLQCVIAAPLELPNRNGKIIIVLKHLSPVCLWSRQTDSPAPN